MSLQQLPLGLELRNPTRLHDFVAGDNQALMQSLRKQLSEDGETQIYIHAPSGTGRTHLLLGQCNAAREAGWSPVYLAAGEIESLSPQLLEGMEQYPLLAIDDIDQLAGRKDWEQALFALFNRARERGCRLLFSATNAPAKAGFELADLSSRLAWGITFRLRPLADSQRQRLLIALSERRGLEMPIDVARYLLQRYSRDIPRLVALVERLDRDSLAEKRRLTIPFVRSRLAS